MNRSKYISYLLLVVSFVMLVASVFPHHHHFARICLQEEVEYVDCEDVSCTTCHHQEGDCHHHSTSDPCEQGCVTRFSPLVSPLKALLHVPSFVLFSFCNVWEESGPVKPDSSTESLRFYYLEHLHSVSLYSIGGLRAPPLA